MTVAIYFNTCVQHCFAQCFVPNGNTCNLTTGNPNQNIGCVRTNYSYYNQSFNSTNNGAYCFNEPDAVQQPTEQPWRFAMCGNNCIDNLNFNYCQSANNLGTVPWLSLPRCQVVSGGRLSSTINPDDHCLKISCEGHDAIQVDPNSGNSRSEITFFPEINEGDHYWYKFSFKLPLGFKSAFDPHSTNYCFEGSVASEYGHFFIAQWHVADNMGYPLSFNYKPTNAQGNSANWDNIIIDNPMVSPGHIDTFKPDENMWYDVVMHIIWSTTSQGYTEVSVYDENCKLVSYGFERGHNMVLNHDTELPYANNFQAGIYRGHNFNCNQSIFFDEFALTNDICCHPFPYGTAPCGDVDCCSHAERKTGNSISAVSSQNQIDVALTEKDVTFKLKYNTDKLENLKLVVYDLYGRTVITDKFNENNQLKLNRSVFKTGMYVYSVYGNLTSNVYQGKFMIQ